MTTEQHDPWALLREARDQLVGVQGLGKATQTIARIDAALAERQVVTKDIPAMIAEIKRLTVERDAARLAVLALPIDPEADAMFDAIQPSLGTPVPPERRIRRQADVDAAFARGAEAMRTALLQRVSWGSDLSDRIRDEPVPEDK